MSDNEDYARNSARVLAAFYHELLKADLPADLVAEAMSAFIQSWATPPYEEAE